MEKLEIREHQLSGARLTVPFTIFGRLGPKHHAMIVGVNVADDQLWVAELSRKFGQRLVSLEQWLQDNRKFVHQLAVEQNGGTRSNAEVSQSAIAEIMSQQESGYNLIFNNCETFVDRHTLGVPQFVALSPQVAKALKAAGIVIATGAVVLSKTRKRNRP